MFFKNTKLKVPGKTLRLLKYNNSLLLNFITCIFGQKILMIVYQNENILIAKINLNKDVKRNSFFIE
jgi:hypothetical protein